MKVGSGCHRRSPPPQTDAGLTARAERREVGFVKKQRGPRCVRTSVCLYCCTRASPPYIPLPHIPLVESSRLVSVQPSQHSIAHTKVFQSNLEHPVLFVRLHPLYSGLIRRRSHPSNTFSFFSSPPSSIVEIQGAVSPPASPSNISGYFSARVLFCPRSAARDPPLFNLLPLMTAKQAKVQVPTPRETRINLQ